MERGETRVDDDFLVDRISDLPDRLIDCILGCLCNDFGLVVRTSVLSKRWRFCWTRMRILYFNLDFLNKYAEPRGLEVDSIVESIFSRHDGPVDQFSLYADDISGRLIEIFDVCRWMKLLSEKRICKISFYTMPDCYVGSPDHIFNCSTLTDLSLNYCDFGPSSDFCGFTNLVSLHLECVEINGSFLETVISNSPLLRDLVLTEIFIDDYHVLINAPGLETLCLLGDFCLKEYPNLTSAYLTLKFDVLTKGHVRTCKLDNLAQVMPKVESLVLGASAWTALTVPFIPMKLPTTLENLKHLELDELDVRSHEQLSCVFCLIRSSPSLQSLEICVNESSGNNDDPEAAERCYEAQEKAGVLSRLSRLKFDNLLGADCEVKFISAFLKSCPKVDTVLISTCRRIESDSEDWLFEELDKLPRPEAVTMLFRSQYEEDALSTSSTD